MSAAASSWGFEDGTVSIIGKKTGVGGGLKEKYVLTAACNIRCGCADMYIVFRLAENKALSKPVSVGASETLRIILTTREDRKAKRPHQAFLNLKDPKSNLETSYAFQVKESGKGKVELVSYVDVNGNPRTLLTGTLQSHKDIPIQLLSSPGPLTASVVIASFGTSKPYSSHAFDLSIALDPSSPLPSQEKPLRYGKLPEIHHIFKSDPTSPPKIITLVFTAAVATTLPILLIAVCT